MAGRKSGLGRGLDALLPTDRPGRGFASLPVDQIVPNPQQPRLQFSTEAISSLAASISRVGVLQPVVVRPAAEDGTYVLIAGERRLRASREAGLTEIPAVIRDSADGEVNLTEALIENVQREDLSALEQAAAFRQLLDDFDLTHDEVAQRVGKSRSAVSNTVRLLSLPADIQALVESGELTSGHARALLSLDDEAYAIHIGERAAAEGWSVRQVEDAVRARAGTDIAKETSSDVVEKPLRPAAIIELEKQLADELGTRVKIDYNGSKGKVVLRFSSLSDLERIYRRLV
jgi:ParB family transcriptional regulator, chromosome partitioning protein